MSKTPVRFPDECRPKYKKASHKDTQNPCAVCGWASHMGIHQFEKPVFKPPFWGHEYQHQKGGAA